MLRLALLLVKGTHGYISSEFQGKNHLGLCTIVYQITGIKKHVFCKRRSSRQVKGSLQQNNLYHSTSMFLNVTSPPQCPSTPQKTVCLRALFRHSPPPLSSLSLDPLGLPHPPTSPPRSPQPSRETLCCFSRKLVEDSYYPVRPPHLRSPLSCTLLQHLPLPVPPSAPPPPEFVSLAPPYKNSSPISPPTRLPNGPRPARAGSGGQAPPGVPRAVPSAEEVRSWKKA